MKTALEQFGIEFLAGCAFTGLVLAVLIPLAVKKGLGVAIRALFGLVGVLAVAAAVTTAVAVSHPLAAIPAPCRVAATSLPSGDAIKVDGQGNAWTAGTDVKGTVSEFVCTDGRLVRVSGYGV
jgi:hypothetical protein